MYQQKRLLIIFLLILSASASGHLTAQMLALDYACPALY